MSPTFLTLDLVLDLHRRIIERFGGLGGVRDHGLLQSAVAMPRATFGGRLLHEGPREQAAAYHFHLCSNHPFMDGNKRVAVVASELFLVLNGWSLTASDDAFEELTLGVAGGTLPKETVIAFFRRYSTGPKPAGNR